MHFMRSNILHSCPTILPNIIEPTHTHDSPTHDSPWLSLPPLSFRQPERPVEPAHLAALGACDAETGIRSPAKSYCCCCYCWGRRGYGRGRRGNGVYSIVFISSAVQCSAWHELFSAAVSVSVITHLHAYLHPHLHHPHIYMAHSRHDTTH